MSWSSRVLASNVPVYYLRHRQPDGVEAYYFLKVPPAMNAEFRKVLEGTERFMFEDYGEVLASGTGQPSQELLGYMKEHYGVTLNEP